MLILGEMANVMDGKAESRDQSRAEVQVHTKGCQPVDSSAHPPARPALRCSHPLASNVTGGAYWCLPPTSAVRVASYSCQHLVALLPISAAVKCLQKQNDKRVCTVLPLASPAPQTFISTQIRHNAIKHPQAILPTSSDPHDPHISHRFIFALPRTECRDRQKSGPRKCQRASRWCGAYAASSTRLQLDRLALSSTRAHPSAAAAIGPAV